MAAIKYRTGECRTGGEHEACKRADPANGGFARFGDVCCAVVLLEDTFIRHKFLSVLLVCLGWSAVFTKASQETPAAR